MSTTTVRFPIEKYSQIEGARWTSCKVDDALISEEPLQIWLKHFSTPDPSPHLLATLMRTPGDDINLVRGWLYTSGLITSLAFIHTIHYMGQGRLKNTGSNQILVSVVKEATVKLAQHQRQEYVNSACGVCGQQSIEELLALLENKTTKIINEQKLLQHADICAVAEKLEGRQLLFQQTGGNHGVALFDEQLRILDVREDVGRHNALDKIIGANAGLLIAENTQAVSPPIGLILSGRVGFEMIQKAAMANIRYVLAFGAPSSLAVQLASETEIALVGFVKKHGYNVYSNPHLLKV